MCHLSLLGIDKKRLVSGECVVTVIKGRPCPHYYFSHCRQQCAAFQSTLICSPAGHAGLGLAPSSPWQTCGGKYQMGSLQLHRHDTISIQNNSQHNKSFSTGGCSSKEGWRTILTCRHGHQIIRKIDLPDLYVRYSNVDCVTFDVWDNFYSSFFYLYITNIHNVIIISNFSIEHMWLEIRLALEISEPCNFYFSFQKFGLVSILSCVVMSQALLTTHKLRFYVSSEELFAFSRNSLLVLNYTQASSNHPGEITLTITHFF